MTTFQKIKHLYNKCLVDCNEWETEFLGDMHERVLDGEGQNLPEDEYFITTTQAEKIDEIWEKVGL